MARKMCDCARERHEAILIQIESSSVHSVQSTPLAPWLSQCRFLFSLLSQCRFIAPLLSQCTFLASLLSQCTFLALLAESRQVRKHQNPRIRCSRHSNNSRCRATGRLIAREKEHENRNQNRKYCVRTCLPCRVQAGTGAIAPPGATRVTPQYPSGVGPREDQV